jgi:flagellin-like protein
MEIRSFLSQNRAVSPVIGVILMVAITVILAAVIGTFVLGLGDQVSQTTPNASFGFDYEAGTNDTIEIAHNGGDTIPASEVNATVSGALDENGNSVTFSGDLFSGGDVSAGSAQTLTESDFTGTGLDLSEATVRVVWASDEGDSSAQLGRWSGPDA